MILPARVTETHAPSGGDVYDRRVCEGLSGAGWSVHASVVPGAWPRPAAADRAALAAALAAVPDGRVVLLDGLVAGAAPETVCPEAGRLRLVVLVHLPLGDDPGLDAATAAELSSLERRAVRAATAVVATSHWTARRVIERHGVPASRVHVAHPGVDPSPLAPATAPFASATASATAATDPATPADQSGADRPGADRVAVPATGAGGRLLCVAAVTPVKAQDVLVEALARIAGLPWRCECVGSLASDPAYVDRIRTRIREVGLTGRVLLAGPRTGDALAASYAAADLVVLASRMETYGMVLTEALARGIPVVAADVGGVREALGPPTGGEPANLPAAPPGQLTPPADPAALPGLLVPAADPAALAAALRRWLVEPETRQRLRQHARARRATLTGWDATVRTMIEVLEASVTVDESTVTGEGPGA